MGNLIFAVVLPAVIPTGPERVFEEADGIVVVEVESAPVTAEWKKETGLEGFTGDCYYTWQGGNLFRSPGTGLLTYRIVVLNPAKYHLRIHNRHDFHDSTEQNDCWTRMDDGPWLKTYSSVRGEWTWHSQHEYSHSKKVPASYDLDIGLHTFQISGRSKGFSIDRFHLYQDGVKDAEDKTKPQSSCGIPPMPELTALERVASYWRQGRLGMALRTAEGNAKSTDAAEAKEAEIAISTLTAYVKQRREKYAGMKGKAPLAAAELLAALGKRLSPSETGRELLREAGQWSREPAALREQQARRIFETMVKSPAEEMLGKGSAGERRFASRYRKQITCIKQGIALLEGRYADTRAAKKAMVLAERLGIAIE